MTVLRTGQAPRGASTITQQLAKNLYLSPSYDPLRKVKELIIARRLEVGVAKTRILELYLNVIEWGDGSGAPRPPPAPTSAFPQRRFHASSRRFSRERSSTRGC